MEEIKQRWKSKLPIILIAILIIVVYKILDNFSSISEWFIKLVNVLKPFIIGILISYILYKPCTKIEQANKKSKLKIISKNARNLAIFSTYIITLIIIIIVSNWIFPVIRDSIGEIINNGQNYYQIAINKYAEIPEDSILKNEIIKEKIMELQNIDIKQFLAASNEKLVEYLKNIVNLFFGIFDMFVSVIVSIYILAQRSAIIEFLRKFTRAVFSKEKYEIIDKYFTKGNEVFLTFISSQLTDAVIVWIVTTIAMITLKVKYASLLGFLIGLFNMIPYIGAIVAVGIAILITLITGGIGKTILMAIVIVVLQQIDANVINPKIVGNSLKISPLLVIFAITLGGAYFGIIGMFLAVPIAVVIKTILCDFIDSKNQKKDIEESIE